ncbi:MAG: PD-(D/E)XK nuclease family protein [Planctomycetes bacterium]|nr:PD-(D/E)XK nuclease family protein [Planctomycetota bacterium]
MYSEKMFLGGTCDAVAEIDGKKYVVDFKTQAKMWDKTPFLQTAAYQLMLEEMGEKDFHGSLILLLPKGGKLEEHYDFDLDTNKKGFLAALDLYRIINSK